MQVAKANDIKYAPTECHHEGDCAGTCPKCESEVRWLEQQLQLRRQLGKAVAVVGVSMGLAALTACDSKTARSDSGNDSLAIESETAGYVERVPDTILTVRQAVDTTVTGQNDKRNTPPAASQAVEPEFIDATVGEVAPPEPESEPVSSSSFPGGQQALLKFLSENIQYPEQAKKDSIEGKVVVKFNVETDGSITNPKIARGLHPLLDAEALRVVNLMPKWESGKQGVLYLPITFKME